MTDSHTFQPLTRVEGEGALEFSVRNQQIEELKLRIFEPPRYFEKFLEGRFYYDVPDIVARICGICPVAYQLTAVQALEKILVPDMPEDFKTWLDDMRTVMYCGEWIQSHALHVHLLALPDLLGFGNAIAMAGKHPDEVRRGVTLQGLGNRLIGLFGGRSVHPVGTRVGGYSKAPDPAKVETLLNDMQTLYDDAVALVEWIDELPMPDTSHDFINVALASKPDRQEYAIYQGDILSSTGQRLNTDQYQDHYIEHQVPHSTAFHSLVDGQPYLVGPLARLNLCQDDLPDTIKAITAKLKTRFPNQNMFTSMLARAVEICFSIQEAKRILEKTTSPAITCMKPVLRAGIGTGATEAPRGLLWHRYEVDKQGRIVTANIIPPTSQNQARIEADLHHAFTQFGLDKPDDELRQFGEMVIRNYDPCISCSTHFLKLKVHRHS